MHRPETSHGYTPNVQIRFEAWWIRNKPNLKVWMQGDIPQLEKPIQLSAPYSDDKPFSITCMVPQDSLINWKVGVQDGNGPIRWANKSRCVYATYNFSASWLLWDDSPFDPPNLYHSHTTTSTTSTSSTYHSYHHNQPSTSSTPHTIPLPYERHNTSPQPSPRQTPVPQNTPLTPHTPTTHSSSNSTSMVTPTHHYTPNSAASSPFLTPNHQSSPLTSPRSIPMPKIHKSLLIGINYNGQPRHLSTPTQDVSTMRDLLSRFGYPDTSEYMRILVDEPSAMISPTRQHIMESLQWLVFDCKPGHQLFLMFSGFNTIVQSQYSEKEDTILPVDFQQTGEITDEILYQTLLSSLPSGVSLTIVMDGSQGGTLLELPYIYRSSRSSHISSEMTENPKWNNKARRYIQSRTALPKVYADVVSIGIEPNSASGDYSPRVDSCCRSLARIAQSSYQGLMWLEIMEQMKEMMPQRSPIMASNVASTLTKPFSL